MPYFVCDKCLGGFRENLRSTWKTLGLLLEGDKCKGGGTYSERTFDEAVGQHGALDVMSQRTDENKPN